MTQLKANRQNQGRYVQGGKTDDLGNRIGWWERKVFNYSSSDVTLKLPAKYNRRPDLLAFDLYGKAGLQWFILQYNVISDITDFENGLILTLPTRSRLLSEMLTNNQ